MLVLACMCAHLRNHTHPRNSQKWKARFVAVSSLAPLTTACARRRDEGVLVLAVAFRLARQRLRMRTPPLVSSGPRARAPLGACGTLGRFPGGPQGTAAGGGHQARSNSRGTEGRAPSRTCARAMHAGRIARTDQRGRCRRRTWRRTHRRPRTWEPPRSRRCPTGPRSASPRCGGSA